VAHKDFSRIISKVHETGVSAEGALGHCHRTTLRLVAFSSLWCYGLWPLFLTPILPRLAIASYPYLQHQHSRPVPRKSLYKGTTYDEVVFTGDAFADEHVWVCYWGGTRPASWRLWIEVAVCWVSDAMRKIQLGVCARKLRAMCSS
jgi:hypothetical protein